MRTSSASLHLGRLRLRSWWLGCCLLIIFILPAGGATAVTTFLNDEYLVENWRTEDGLPQNSITSIVQTPDGYIWLSTFNGIVRFDGVKFRVFDAVNTPELRSSRVIGLRLDKQGTIWTISMEGYVTMIRQGRFTQVSTNMGLPDGPLGLLGADPDGEIWVREMKGETNYRTHNGRFIPAPPTQFFSEEQLKDMRPAANNVLWFRQGTNWIHGDDQSLLRVNGCEPGPNRRLGVAIQSKANGMWIMTPCETRFYSEGKWGKVLGYPFDPQGTVSHVEDRDGNLWICTWAEGLLLFMADGRSRQFDLAGGVEREAVRAVLEDNEGNIWVGMDGSGLYRLRKRVVHTYGVNEGLRGHVVRSVVEDIVGKIWVFDQRSVDWLRPGTYPLIEPSPLDVGTPWCGLPGRDGEMWIGSLGGGVYSYRGEELKSWPVRGESERPNCTVLFRDSTETLWLGADVGLWQFAGDGFDQVNPLPAMPPLDVRAMAETRTGEIFIGLNGGGLLRREHGRWERLTAKDGLVNERVWSLYADPRGALWIGTYGSGLLRYQAGKFFHYPLDKVWLPRLVGSIKEDDLGHLWMGSDQGIFRVSRQELEEYASGQRTTVSTVQFGRNDGMESSECMVGSQSVTWKARDGRLWFSTVRGVSVVDPQALRLNTRPPGVAIEEVVADETVYSDYPGRGESASARAESLPNPLVISAGTHRLEFHFAVLSFVAPNKTRFRYQLEGVDPDWVDGTGPRVATYTQLRPGQYSFRVKASNNDGVWNNVGTSLSVVILPHYWQTGWFIGGMLVAFACLLMWAYDRRVRRLKRAQALQESFARKLIDSQEQERKRIAGELHDSLGQNLLVIKNRAAFALAGVKGSPPPDEVLAEISQVASETLEEVRTISHNLRPYQLDRLNLTKALQALGRNFSKLLPEPVLMEIDPIDNLFPPEQQISLYRIVQEAMNNIVKHSGAQSARISIRRSERRVVLCIEDDGKGFDAAAFTDEARGFGLTSMAERVRFLGGHLSFDSATGQGTRLNIELPIPHPR